jgi:hypothetical protein
MAANRSTILTDKVGNNPPQLIANNVADQEKLLNLFRWIDADDGGAMNRSIKPMSFVRGTCAEPLAVLIREFQTKQIAKRKLNIRFVDGEVSPAGPTLRLLNELASREKPVPNPVPPPPTPGRIETVGVWQITDIKSVMAFSPLAVLLQESLKRRGVPVDVDAKAIEMSGLDWALPPP